jgi:hypothetical protein
MGKEIETFSDRDEEKKVLALRKSSLPPASIHVL